MCKRAGGTRRHSLRAADGAKVPDAYVTPAALKPAVDSVELKQVSRHTEKCGESFVQDTALATLGLWSDEACQPLTDLLHRLTRMRTAPPAWIADWRPLRTHMHNDLNAANVLVDLQVCEPSDQEPSGGGKPGLSLPQVQTLDEDDTHLLCTGHSLTMLLCARGRA
eukprot:1833856-Prymnesium_polylepis.2